MLVALYDHHHSLPFWRNPDNPYAIFDRKSLEGWGYLDQDGNRTPASDHPIVPVLIGLNDLRFPGLMAHVSFIIDQARQAMEWPKRCWVQITTAASERDSKGLPIVVRDGRVQVEHAWGRDNGTYYPHQWLEPEQELAGSDANIWSAFFFRRLREAEKELFAESERHFGISMRLKRAADCIMESRGLNGHVA